MESGSSTVLNIANSSAKNFNTVNTSSSVFTITTALEELHNIVDQNSEVGKRENIQRFKTKREALVLDILLALQTLDNPTEKTTHSCNEKGLRNLIHDCTELKRISAIYSDLARLKQNNIIYTRLDGKTGPSKTSKMFESLTEAAGIKKRQLELAEKPLSIGHLKARHYYSRTLRKARADNGEFYITVKEATDELILEVQDHNGRRDRLATFREKREALFNDVLCVFAKGCDDNYSTTLRCTDEAVINHINALTTPRAEENDAHASLTSSLTILISDLKILSKSNIFTIRLDGASGFSNTTKTLEKLIRVAELKKLELQLEEKCPGVFSCCFKHSDISYSNLRAQLELNSPTIDESNLSAVATALYDYQLAINDLHSLKSSAFSFRLQGFSEAAELQGIIQNIVSIKDNMYDAECQKLKAN